MPTMPLKSPMTGGTVEGDYYGESKTLFWFDHRAEDHSDLIFEETLLRASDQGWSGLSFSREQALAAIDLLRSYAWRASYFQTREILVTTRSMAQSRQQELEQHGIRDIGEEYSQHLPIILPFEDLISQVEALGFEEKTMKTLENLYDIRVRGYAELTLPYAHDPLSQGKFSISSNATYRKNTGIAYGCDAFMAVQVLQFILDQKWIKLKWFRPAGRELAITWEMTPTGIIEVERYRRGAGQMERKAFFVRQWNPDKDAYFAGVSDSVRDRLQCPIQAVWDIEHVEKIDERIFRLIREAAVIVVDITGSRFNVGLELGYALALGKPIVVIRDDAERVKRKKPQIPFDIGTLNCYDYRMDDPAALIEKLVARVGLALSLQPLRA